MADRGPGTTPLCERHDWSFEERGDQTWSVCLHCGMAELWAGGILIDTTDQGESSRLDEVENRENNLA